VPGFAGLGRFAEEEEEPPEEENEHQKALEAEAARKTCVRSSAHGRRFVGQPRAPSNPLPSRAQGHHGRADR
jgi:hypothetical protein